MSVCLTHFIKTGASIVLLSVGMQPGSQNGEYWCWNVLISVECTSDAVCEHSASMTSADEGVKIEGRSTNLPFSELQLVHTFCCSPPHIKPRTSAWCFSVSEWALLFLGGVQASLVVLVYGRVSFYVFFFYWRYNPLWVCILQPSSGAIASSRTRFLDHTQRATVGRTSLDVWSARRRDLYLTTHNTHNRQTSMPSVGFEPTIAAGERP